MIDRLPSHIRGIQFWAVSYCRSTLGFYEALAKVFDVPFRVCLARAGIGARGEIGFSEEEFSHLDLVETTDKVTARRALSEHSDWLQLFGTYQSAATLRFAHSEALRRGLVTGIASEAPCNMEKPGLRRFAKTIYLKHVLPHRVAKAVKGARFILNWSGDDCQSLVELGWPREKIIPLGYFPPPLPGTSFTLRKEKSHSLFRILCSSSLTWHRGPDLLMEALVLLKNWGVPFEATFTGTGPLETALRARAKAQSLPVRLVGRVPMDDLIDLYETCSIFVAPGRQEPWGIRVNDAVNAGAPVIVSRGMGAAKLVEDYDVGASFAAGDVTDLAWKLRRVANDQGRFLLLNKNLAEAREALLPEAAANRVAAHITSLLDEDQAS